MRTWIVEDITKGVGQTKGSSSFGTPRLIWQVSTVVVVLVWQNNNNNTVSTSGKRLVRKDDGPFIETSHTVACFHCVSACVEHRM